MRKLPTGEPYAGKPPVRFGGRGGETLPDPYQHEGLVMDEDRLPVGSLRNLGPKSAMLLAEAGIRTIAELRILGPAKAYQRAKALKPRSVSLNLLWALAAGLADRDWRDLTQKEKDSLLAQIRSLR